MGVKDPVNPAMIWGAEKIPAPMVMPTRMVIPSKSPRDLRSVGREGLACGSDMVSDCLAWLKGRHG